MARQQSFFGWRTLGRKTVEKEKHMNTETQWQSLTDEEIQQALGINAESSNWNLVKVLEWAKKIEAALLEKNHG